MSSIQSSSTRIKMKKTNKDFEKLVLKSLSKNRYKHIDPSRRDVMAVLNNFKGLAPQLDTYVFENGDEKPLLNINGTIPISYRNNTYNIPMCFWLLPDYPNSPPMSYVKPTQDMQIRSSRVVEKDGRISLPYLQQWKHPDSNLLGLMYICVSSFGQAPPVFSKIKSSSTTNQSNNSTNSLQHQTSLNESSSSSAIISTSNESTSSLVNHAQVSRQCSLQNQNLIANNQMKIANAYSNHSNTTPTNGTNYNNDDIISQEHLRISLISAVEDVVKIKLEEEFMKTRAEVESLHHTNKELLDSQDKINDTLRTFETQTINLDKYYTELEEKSEELNETLEKLNLLEKDPIQPDQIIMPGNRVHNQILDAVAMDSALDDSIYHLGLALHQGLLECDVYLKKVRNLSRKQFQQRLTIHKWHQNLN